MKHALSTVVIFVSLIFSSSRAWADGPKIWIENPGGFSGDSITNGKTTLSQGAFGAFDLRELVKGNAAALALADQAAHHQTKATWIDLGGSLPTLTVALVCLFTKSYGAGLAFAGASVGLSFWSLYEAIQARHFMFESINTFNGVATRHAKRDMWQPYFSVDPFSKVKSVSVAFRF